MSLTRMTTALKLALKTTDQTDESRYTTAMKRRANDILDRADTNPIPDGLLPKRPNDLASSIRQNGNQNIDLHQLRNYVQAKLAISNPDSLTKDS